MKFYVEYFGCRSNQAEVQEWIIELEKHGFELTKDILQANFGILNTCSVTERAEKDCFKYIDKSQKNLLIPWFVTGCTVSRDFNRLSDAYPQLYFLKNDEKENLVDTILSVFPDSDNVIYHSSFKSRVFLKIQDGCNFRCSYCIVPFLRGPARSISGKVIEKKARYYVSLGYREVVLTGINLSSYGFDLSPTESLMDVIHLLRKIVGIEFIRISSLDPRYIDYSFIKQISYIRKIAPSFHLSFQSGCNAVLRRMKRGNKVEDYYKILNDFRKFFPMANIGADFIVGFPEESDREFMETLEFIKASGLNYLHVFPYSPRPGTRAETYQQVSADVIRKRAIEVKNINRNLKLNYRYQFVGKILNGIYIETTDHHSVIVTGNYLNVKATPAISGFRKRKLKVKITQVIDENMCEGIIVEND
jgi:threonylcarbamoyladenosine tRNA methylthiotransferase MtaB